MSKSWYDTGYNGMKREEDRISGLGTPQRFWVKPETSRDFVFVDDEPFCIYEHNPKINGDWKNWITCLKGSDVDEPCCDTLGIQSRYYVGYYTVVDCTEWTDKKGNKHQFEVKLLPAKLKTLKKIKRKRDERGSLVGCLFTAHREDSKSPTIGDEFEFKREVNVEKLFESAIYSGKKLTELYTKATTGEGAAANLEKLGQIFKLQIENGVAVPKITSFNYFEILKPQSASDVKAMLKGYVPEENTKEKGFGKEGKADEDIPF